ncbi:TetR family transcriptional regulator ActII [Actinoallomurus liliacearum]|uniref:TetR family transcriptional regulator ActII n=1 Tax=Actinoallomurus liliacearum TaxID=1080073 RepID=A0ABP8TMG0_9ACTN
MESVRGGPAAGDEQEPDGLPTPGWRPAAKPPRIPLTREAILDAALRVLDREGLEGLSMRRVSDELGTGPASIYGHVRNKDELLQLLHERVTDEIRLPEPDPSRWYEQLEELAGQMRGLMNHHRDIARISLGRIPSGPTIARFTEWLFQLLTPVGIPDQTIAYLGDVFGLYVGAFAFEEGLGVASPIGEDLPPDQIMDMFRGYLQSLPADRFPHVHRMADALFDTDFDARFTFGIDLLLRGLRTYAEDAPPPSTET